VHHHSLDDRALAEERFALGLGHRLLVRVMTEQSRPLLKWMLEYGASDGYSTDDYFGG
jgi:hypothetical protein